nr:hypothetical protein [Clostridioides sp.]
MIQGGGIIISKEYARVEFKNGSTIEGIIDTENSRGFRSNMFFILDLEYDRCFNFLLNNCKEFKKWTYYKYSCKKRIRNKYNKKMNLLIHHIYDYDNIFTPDEDLKSSYYINKFEKMNIIDFKKI